MKRSNLSVLVACALLLPAFASAQDVGSQEAMIPSSAMAAIFAQPKSLLQTPGMELMPTEVLSVMGQKELGFDPCEITEAMVLVESFSDLEKSPGFALVLKFDSAQQPGDKLTRGFAKDQLDGRGIYRNGEDVPAILQYDETTIVFGMEPFIKKMLAARGAQSQLINLINAKKNDTHVSAFVTIEPARGLIIENLPPVEQVPPPFQGFLELPNLIDSIVLKMDYSEQQNGSLEILAVDDTSVGKIDRIFRQAITTGRQFAMGYIANEMRDQDPDLQRAVAAYSDRIGNYLEANYRPARDGNSIIFSAEGQQNAQLANVATIGVLVGMLLPAVQQAREAARRSESMNRMRQIALAVLNYESAYKKFPNNILDKDGNPLLSWRVAILPFMEENALYEQFHLDEPWDSEHNIQLLPMMPSGFQNANVPFDDKTVFLGFAGQGTIFGKDQIGFGNISDGSSNTILVVEANMDEAIEWSRPADLPFDRDRDVSAVGQLRPGGFNAVLCDGSVQFIAESIEQETLKNLIQRDDGNVVNFR